MSIRFRPQFPTLPTAGANGERPVPPTVRPGLLGLVAMLSGITVLLAVLATTVATAHAGDGTARTYPVINVTTDCPTGPTDPEVKSLPTPCLSLSGTTEASTPPDESPSSRSPGSTGPSTQPPPSTTTSADADADALPVTGTGLAVPLLLGLGLTIAGAAVLFTLRWRVLPPGDDRSD